MRVIAGRLRGRRICAPGNLAVRPTYDRVRESVFGILGDGVQGARVLDLFAGSGSLGIEALSRGAASATFIELDPAVLRVAKSNIDRLGLSGVCTFVRGDVVGVLSGRSLRRGFFDLVFLDPPYESRLVGKTLELLSAWDGLAPGCTVVAERRAGDDALGSGHGLRVVRTKTYGGTVVDFLKGVASRGEDVK